MNALENSPGILAALGIGAILVHIPLFWARQYNLTPLYLGLFLVLDPLSAVEENDVTVVKYARVYCTVLMTLSAFLSPGRFRLGLASTAFLIFSIYFALSALWSDLPGPALLAKGPIFLTALVAGLSCGDHFRSPEMSRNSTRWLIIFAAAVAAVSLPAALLSIAKGVRFTPWLINPVRIGSSAYAFFVFAMVGVFSDTKWYYKVTAGIASCSLALVIVATGTRGAAASAAIVATFILLLGLRWNINRLTLAALLLVGFLVISATFITSEQLRFLEREGLTGRESLWEAALWNTQRGSLLLGSGWLYGIGSLGGVGSMNVHNAYLQILLESGIVGCTLFAIAIVAILLTAARSLLLVRRTLRETNRIYTAMAIGLIFAGLGHAIAESGLVQGSSAATIMFALALGIVDRTVFNASRETGRAHFRFPVNRASAWKGHLRNLPVRLKDTGY